MRGPDGEEGEVEWRETPNSHVREEKGTARWKGRARWRGRRQSEEERDRGRTVTKGRGVTKGMGDKSKTGRGRWKIGEGEGAGGRMKVGRSRR